MLKKWEVSSFGIKYAGVIWLLFLVRFVRDSLRIKEQGLQRHMFKRDWTTFSEVIEDSTLNSGRNWEELCIQLQHEHACTSE